MLKKDTNKGNEGIIAATSEHLEDVEAFGMLNKAIQAKYSKN